MLRWTRSRSRQEQGQSSSQAPNPPSPHNEDPDPAPDSDDDYDPEARQYEHELGFTIPSRRMYRKVASLYRRNFYNTRLFDEETLDKLGMGREVTQLLTSVGFTHQFCHIREKAYRNLTIEFLSSISLETNDEGEQCVTFRMGNQTRNVLLSDLAEYLGFEIEGTDSDPEFQFGESRASLWEKLTGHGPKKDFKVSWIQHPTLRVLHRVIVSTIYARGETMARLNTEDAILLDNILRAEPPKVNLTLLMVQHWEGIAGNSTENGYITMGAYATLIAKKLRVRFDKGSMCSGYPLLNLKALKRFGFIEIEENDNGERYTWVFNDRPNFYLPYPYQVAPTQPTTWLVANDYNPPQQEFQDFAGLFRDPPHCSGTHSAGTSRAAGRARPSGSEDTDPTSTKYKMTPLESLDYLIESIDNLNVTSIETRNDVKELHRISNETKEEIRANTERLERVDKRLTTWEDEFAFYKEHGYWRGGPNDPDMMQTEPVPPPPQSPYEQPLNMPPYTQQQPPSQHGGPYDSFSWF